MALVQRLINVSFHLADGNFAGGGNSYTVTGLRVSATIDISGGIESGTLVAAIYGLPLEVMNQLSTVGTQMTKIGRNLINIQAGDAAGGMNTVFQGLINNAYADMQSMPQACFRVQGSPGGSYWSVKPVPPVSLKGTQDTATMLQSIASQMGVGFENNGVKVKLSNPYYSGSPWTQAWRIAKHAGVEMVIDKGVMAITPPGKVREGNTTLVSPQTGMIGYPAFRSASVIVKSLYRPDIKVLGAIQIQSDLTPANGQWKVYHLIYELESMMPHGKWFMTMECTALGGSQ